MQGDHFDMNKLPIFEWFFALGDVLVTVNTRSEGVDIPKTLDQQEMVDFIFGENPTPKVEADEYGVSAPMRFSGSLYPCYFPWSSIVQMSGRDAVIQFRNAETSSEAETPAKPEKHAKKNRGNLRIVK